MKRNHTGLQGLANIRRELEQEEDRREVLRGGTIAAVIVALAIVLASFGCHTLDIYRPVPPPAPPADAPADPRPDLPGKPVGPGHPLYNAEAWLREHFPTDRPWVLRSSPLQGNLLGVTHYDAPGWLAGEVPESGALVVEVRDDLEGWQQREVLCHEYAHVVTWDFPETAHGAVWSAVYGAIYRGARGEQ